MYILSDKENDLASKIIGKGLRSAAEAFSEVVQQKITVEVIEIKTVKVPARGERAFTSGQEISMLTTDLMGEGIGKSYLLLNEGERRAICGSFVAPQWDAAGRKEMEEAILKEIDNIISAAVITQFSNALGISIYGDVPHLVSLPSKEVAEAIRKDLACTQVPFLMISASFLSEYFEAFQPRFFWILSARFLERIRELAS